MYIFYNILCILVYDDHWHNRRLPEKVSNLGQLYKWKCPLNSNIFFYRYTAKDKHFLVKHGFTHVLNSSEGIDSLQVNTSADYYRNIKITYLGIPGHDRPTWDIGQYFQETSKFIDTALTSGGTFRRSNIHEYINLMLSIYILGKVLVHCVMGISRSATLVIAYLMMYRGMSATQAITHVFRKRRINPNMGFLEHLAQLNFKLKNLLQ